MTAGPGSSDESDPNKERERKISKETIHSGHFMVSDFEAEAQDEEGVEVPDPAGLEGAVEEIPGVMGINQGGVITYAKPTSDRIDGTTVSIDASLTKLFQTMSLAYRQNITSPKWNRFKGLRLRWKDKIRLNNVIWRCWHMQYMQKKMTTVCQFALDVDIHNRPEAVVLEGKYWKRRLKAVTAEYRKWRVFYKNKFSGEELLSDQTDMLTEKSGHSSYNYKSFLGLEEMDWAGNIFFKSGTSLEGSVTEWDFTDMLFSTFNTSPQLFPFPNPREIARGTGNSDLLQPGLIQLQPDLADDDMMDIHEMLAGRGALPTVPEEDFFPDVEDAVGLPPSSPLLSTPTSHRDDEAGASPRRHAAFARPPSPPTFSTQHMFIATRDVSPTHHHSNPDVKAGGRPHQAVPFARSHSAQELYHSRPSSEGPTPSGEAGLRELAPATASFVVPKNIHKKYSLGNSPFGSPTSPGSITTGATTIVFPQSTSPPGPPQMTPLTTLDSNVCLEQVLTAKGAAFSPQPESNLFAHLLTPEACVSVAPPGQHSPHHVNKIKVARITPRPYPDVTISAGLASRAGSGLISAACASTTTTTVSNATCGANGTVGGLPLVPTSDSGSQGQLLPHITLSAVTPSSIKTIQVNPSAQVSNWSFSGQGSFPLKRSPPHSEAKASSTPHTAPSPPSKPFRPKNDVERVQYREHRRVCHINAEQKRRCNIKNNFEMLHSLIPAVNQNPNAKVSKATMLHKGAEYIMQMKQERQQLNDKAEQLRSKIEMLSSDISLAQSLLPATGAPVTHTRHNKIKEKFDAYIRERTLSNPKYYVLSLVAQPLLETFNSTVSTGSVDDLCSSSKAWLDQHCSLSVLRPVVSNAMRKLSITTNILTTPETLYEDIFRQVTKQEETKSNNVQYSSR